MKKNPWETYREWAIPQKKTAKKLSLWAKKYIKKGEIILDCGSGVGFLVEEFLLTNPTIALDISFPALSLNPSPIKVKANMEKLPFKNKSVEWIISSFSLHWTNYRKSIKEFFRVAKKGFFLAVPIEGSLTGIGFPFPKEREILELINPDEKFTEIVDIPFRGRNFLLFFKKTQTHHNPHKKLSAFEILKKPSLIKNYSFKVIYLFKKLN